MSKLNWEKQNKLEQPKERKRRLDREKVAKAYANGSKNERERIMKLLEDYIPTFYELSPNTDEGKYPIEHLIELIKGEQK